MKITFKTDRNKETLQKQILNWGSKVGYSLKHYFGQCWLEEDAFNSYATVSYEKDANDTTPAIVITTAWSGFKYHFRWAYRETIQGKKFHGSVCTYEGAYKGLLNQDLLPKFNSMSVLLDCPVESSLGNFPTLRKYITEGRKEEIPTWLIKQSENPAKYTYGDE